MQMNSSKLEEACSNLKQNPKLTLNSYKRIMNMQINSYKRINAVPTISGSSWSPNTVSWTGNNRSHMIRVPDAPRFEMRLPDSVTLTNKKHKNYTPRHLKPSSFRPHTYATSA